MGSLTVTIQNLEIVAVDLANNVILIKGNIPGPKKGLVVIKTSVKTPGKVNETENLISYTETPEVVETEVTEEVVEETATEEATSEETSTEEN